MLVGEDKTQQTCEALSDLHMCVGCSLGGVVVRFENPGCGIKMACHPGVQMFEACVLVAYLIPDKEGLQGERVCFDSLVQGTAHQKSRVGRRRQLVFHIQEA